MDTTPQISDPQKPLDDLDAHNVEQDRLSTFRRYIFASWTTALNLLIVALISYRGDNGLLSQQTINAAYGYMELMAALLLGASVIDRTSLVDKITNSRFMLGDRDEGRPIDNHNGKPPC